jgi:predicted component of viral defense system (DUF524 family)
MLINLYHILIGLELEIVGEENTLFEISEDDALQNGEAKIQLVEGCNYEYQFNFTKVKFKNTNKNRIVKFSKFGKNKGTIQPNIFVGTHSLEIEIENDLLKKFFISIEVRSIKSEYREDYRFMLESITERCTDLILQIDSPITQNFETNFDNDNKTLYQRFCFVKSLIDSKEFEESIQKIISNPTTKWQNEIEENDIRGIRRFNQKNIKQLITKSNRVQISNNHSLNKNYSLTSIPLKIYNNRKTESNDTPENRFIKHTIKEFSNFCENCESKFLKFSSAKNEAKILNEKLSSLLNQSFFIKISDAKSLKIDSPVLQKKSGYREVLNAWLKFDLAAKLVWHGGNNVYEGGKKDIATLYEYWLFFELLDLIKSTFQIESKSIEELLQFDKEKISLNLKQGTTIALKGIYNSGNRKINVQFSYNRSFGGNKKYPSAGSYTTTLRPDYTLTFWSEGIINQKDAEVKELISHIHFDAKYKVNNFYELISKSENEELSDFENEELIRDEEEENIKGTFKNQDLLKMHAYKDAIRRTGGAYILYPGEGKNEPFRGFHELIPGVGAFVIKPNRNEKDKEHLKNFILKVVDNFLDRSSQRENTAIKIYDIHKYAKTDEDVLKESFPEYLNENRLIPNETSVLIGFYKSKEQLDWILKNNKYNFRTGTDKGSLMLNEITVNAKYLILHGNNELATNKIFQLSNSGIKIYSKSDMMKKHYPNPTGEIYLIYEIEKEVSNDFNNITFDLRKIEGFESFRNSSKPQITSLTKILKSKNS